MLRSHKCWRARTQSSLPASISWDGTHAETGGSVALGCDEGLGLFYGLEASPDNNVEHVALEDAADDAVAGCVAAHADLLPYLGTDSVVEDLELLRQALGEDEISYLGASYGTAIGLVYAERYGPNVRAMVLDGVLDPRFTLEEWLTSQAIALEDALDTLLGDNVDAYDTLPGPRRGQRRTNRPAVTRAPQLLRRPTAPALATTSTEPSSTRSTVMQQGCASLQLATPPVRRSTRTPQ